LASLANSLVVDRNNALTSIVAPKLRGIVETVSINDHPKLVNVDLRNVEGISGRISFGGNGTDAGTGAPLVFSALASVGNILFFIENESFTSLEFPVLTSSGSFDIAYNKGLTSVAAPLLALSSDVTLRFNLDLADMDFSSLSTVAGTVAIWGNGTAAPPTSPLQFPALTSASVVSVTDNGAFIGLSLGKLVSTTGSFDVMRNTGLSFVTAPVLASVGGILGTSSNPALVSYSVPLLSVVGGLAFHDNVGYCESNVDALAGQLGLAPTTYGNSGNAACQ